MRCLFFSPRKNVGGFISPSDAGRAEGILVGRWGEGGGGGKELARAPGSTCFAGQTGEFLCRRESGSG